MKIEPPQEDFVLVRIGKNSSVCVYRQDINNGMSWSELSDVLREYIRGEFFGTCKSCLRANHWYPPGHIIENDKP